MDHNELDDYIASTARIPLVDASVFFGTLKKLAQGPEPDADLAQHAQGVATGTEPTPEEAEAHQTEATPDTTGHLEGEFAVPVENVVQQLAQIVSNSMRQHTAYAYYSEMMRGLGRGELAELFDDQGADEIEEMQYFLRRMGVLAPGGVPIPVAPTPEPSADPGVALRFLIAGEQQAIVLFKTLHSMLGTNPMKYTVEQTMSDAQDHLDKLWQYMPAEDAEKAAAKQKLAAAIQSIKLAAPQQPQPKTTDIAIPPPGTEPVEQYLARNAALGMEQAQAENEALRNRVSEMETQMIQQGQQLESAAAEAENNAAQAQMASDAATQSTAMAADADARAAAEADAKMRLSMRINQIRQLMADVVSSDPVTEEGVGLEPLATPGQEQEMQQQAEIEQQVEAEQVGGSRAKKEVAQAQRAEDEAAEQKQEAHRAMKTAHNALLLAVRG